MSAARPRVFVVDDEELAIKRLVRMLEATARVEIAGTASDPRDAIARISAQHDIAAVFLDISMPEVDGFAVAHRLPPATLVIFTTAHDEHALRAFEVNALDYLVKPVRADALARALDKLARRRGGPRLTSRVGDRTHVVELDRVTHFYAEDKLTYAIAGEASYVVDDTIAALEERHGADGFFRIHRATLVRLTAVAEVLANPPRVKLHDGSELAVARDRVRALKDVLTA